MAALEKLVKKLTQQPQGTVHVAGAVGGKSPDERLLRRLGSDLALVKKRLDEMAPPKDAGALMRMREGDHAMLAGKPLQGYRQAGTLGPRATDASFAMSAPQVLTLLQVQYECTSPTDVSMSVFDMQMAVVA